MPVDQMTQFVAIAQVTQRSAWVLTLPVAMLMSGSLYWLFTKLF